LAVGDSGPYVTEALAIGVGVSVDSRVLFKELDDIADELADLPLIGTGYKVRGIVDASKLDILAQRHTGPADDLPR
jgi:hypothetical protein